MTLQPKFFPYVLVSPKSLIDRPDNSKFNTDMVIKSDELFKQIERDLESASTLSAMGALAKLISVETLTEFARQLVSYHRPAEIDYYAKFGIKPALQFRIPLKEPEANPTIKKRKRGPQSILVSSVVNRSLSEWRRSAFRTKDASAVKLIA